MEEIKAYKPGTFCWVDLGTFDAGAAKIFYGDIFGWKAVDTPAGEGNVYTMLMLNDKPVAALYEMNEAMKNMNVPSSWMSYVSVDNVDDIMAKVPGLGGEQKYEAMDVFDFGRMGMFADPEGAMLCVWQPKEHIGASFKNAPGTMCWFEHASHDSKASIPFLEKLFGWTANTQKMGDTDYTTFKMDGEDICGLYMMPAFMEKIPSHWLPYFMTDNIDLLIEKSTNAGAKILMPKTKVEGIGDFTVIEDPQGAVFGVLQ